MDIQTALKEQYHAGLAMLAECVEKCPDDMWMSGTHPRTFWRIAFHTAFFAHNYLVRDEAAFNESFVVGRAPSVAVMSLHPDNSTTPCEIEPYELPDGAPPVSKEAIAEYIAYVDALINPTLDTLDLDAAETGFFWYKNMSKLSHELMNLRHIQGHVGQLSELLMACGIDTDWIAKAADMHDSSY